MISNYNLTCDYHNFELKDKIYLIPQWALKIIYTDGFNEVVFSGNSANVTILEGHDINFQEETSFDERFRFSKTLSIKVDGYVTFNDLDNRYMAIIETKEGEFFLVNVDFPSFVTHTYTLNNGTNSTELVFSSQSNIATLKLTNFNPNNVNSCKQYSNAKIKNVKLTEAWASYLSTWQKSLVNKGEFVDIEPLPDSISLTEEFDGEKYTVTLGFDIPMSYYKNDWHIKLLQFEENKYRGYIELEDGNVAFVGYNVGLFPSYTINGDIISIRLQEVAIRGIAYGNDYVLIDTDIPNTIEYNGASCYTYNWLSTCDWHVEDKPDYITITPTSGEANTQYELEICNTDDETGYEVSEFIIKSCHANARADVIINNPIYRWVQTEETMCVPEPIERTVSGDPYCNNDDKYVDVFNEISYDNGETWEIVSSSSTLIEADSPDCGYKGQYLTFVALGNGEISFSSESYDNGASYYKRRNNISYSYDGLTWSPPSPYFSIDVNEGDRVMVKGNFYTPKNNFHSQGSGYFSSSTRFNIEGNIFSLLYGDEFRGKKSFNNGLGSSNTRVFQYIFEKTNVVNAENLILPASGVVDSCYEGMFYGCTSLVSAPELPATTKEADISTRPYYGMFSGCTSLTAAPSTIALVNFEPECYYAMFYGCTSLEVAPKILTSGNAKRVCCSAMFADCTSLTTVPSMDIGNIEEGCFSGMFQGCTSLTATPEINYTEPPTPSQLSSYTGTFSYMFSGCTALKEVSMTMPSHVNHYTCQEMFAGCTSLTDSPILPALYLAQNCYNNMFSNCTSLSAITCLATDISAQDCTSYWTYNVANSGIFYKNPSMTRWSRGVTGIPSGWTIVDYTG